MGGGGVGDGREMGSLKDDAYVFFLAFVGLLTSYGFSTKGMPYVYVRWMHVCLKSACFHFLSKPCSVRRRNRSSRGVCGYPAIHVCRERKKMKAPYSTLLYHTVPYAFFQAGTLRASQPSIARSQGRRLWII